MNMSMSTMSNWAQARCGHVGACGAMRLRARVVASGLGLPRAVSRRRDVLLHIPTLLFLGLAPSAIAEEQLGLAELQAI